MGNGNGPLQVPNGTPVIVTDIHLVQPHVINVALVSNTGFTAGMLVHALAQLANETRERAIMESGKAMGWESSPLYKGPAWPTKVKVQPSN
jgi:hypothetical protein